MTRTRLFSVEGLVCGTCLVAVLERLHELEGVSRVHISLEVGGGSPVAVQCEEWVPPGVLHGAVVEAGFAVTAHTLGAPLLRNPAGAHTISVGGVRA